MTPVTLVMPYYENPGMLKEQFARLCILPDELRRNICVVVVDDGSPNYPAKAEEIGMSLQIYRITVDVRWNQDAARNIGAKHAKTEFLLLTDVDHIVPEDTWRELVGRDDWQDDYAYIFSRCTLKALSPDVLEEYKPHPNSWFMSKKLYDRIGGYDERFAGFYGTDGDFKVRTVAQAKKFIQLPQLLYRVPREVIPDASTTTYKRKEDYDRPTVSKLLKAREREADSRPKRYRFPYERVA